MSSAVRVKLKLHYEGSVRVVALSKGARSSFRELSARLRQDYGFDVVLRYQDVDGDMIMLDSQNDLLELISESGACSNGTSIAVQVSRRAPVPAPAPEPAQRAAAPAQRPRSGAHVLSSTAPAGLDKPSPARNARNVLVGGGVELDI